jgi:hypothetical protein
VNAQQREARQKALRIAAMLNRRLSDTELERMADWCAELSFELRKMVEDNGE